MLQSYRDEVARRIQEGVRVRNTAKNIVGEALGGVVEGEVAVKIRTTNEKGVGRWEEDTWPFEDVDLYSWPKRRLKRRQ